MSEIYFSKNIKTNSGNLSNAFGGNFRNNLTTVYSLPQGLTNISDLFNGCGNLSDLRYELEETLIDINNAFTNCSNLSRDFNIPTSVNTAYRAFDGSNIKRANLVTPSEIQSSSLTDLSYCFANCKNLINVSGFIPDTIINLTGAFMNSGIIVTPILNNTAVNLKSAFNIFRNCHDLSSVFMDFPKKSYSFSMGSAFENCSSLEEYLYDIEAYDVHNTFKGCDNLKNIGTVTAVYGSNTFENCYNLNIVPLYSVDNASNSFVGCNNLNEVNIKGANINNIFSHYENLKSITIDSKQNKILSLNQDLSEFGRLNKNACLNIWASPDSFSVINDLAIRSVLSNNDKAYYQSNYFNKDDYTCSSLSNFNILTDYKLKNTLNESPIVLDNRIRLDVHDSETERDVFYNDSCFANGTNIKQIYSCITGNNLNLGNNCFKNSKITDVDFSSYIPSNNHVFDSCHDLVNVTFAQSENNIPNGLFNDCYNLNNVCNHTLPIIDADYYNSKSPYVCYNIGTNSFANCSNLTDLRFSDIDGCWINDYGLYEVGISNLQLGTYTERLGNNSIYSSKLRDTVNVYGFNIYNWQNNYKVNIYTALGGLSVGGDIRINNFYISNYVPEFYQYNFNNVYLVGGKDRNEIDVANLIATNIDNLIMDIEDPYVVNYGFWGNCFRNAKINNFIINSVNDATVDCYFRTNCFIDATINNFITNSIDFNNINYEIKSDASLNAFWNTVINNMSPAILLSILNTKTDGIFYRTNITVPPTYIGEGYNVLNLYTENYPDNYGGLYIKSTDPNVIYMGRDYYPKDAKYVWGSDSLVFDDDYSNLYDVNRVFEHTDWKDRTILGHDNYFIAKNVTFYRNSLYISNNPYSERPYKYVYVHNAYFLNYAFGEQTLNSQDGDFYYDKEDGYLEEARVIYDGTVNKTKGGNLYKYYDQDKRAYYCNDLNDVTSYYDGGNYETTMQNVLRNAYNTYINSGRIDPQP